MEKVVKESESGFPRWKWVVWASKVERVSLLSPAQWSLAVPGLWAGKGEVSEWKAREKLKQEEWSRGWRASGGQAGLGQSSAKPRL